MKALFRILLPLITLGFLLAACGDQFSTPNPNDDDDDDTTAADDDVADDDDDDGPTPEEVQDELNNILGWASFGGCSQVTVYAANADASVEIEFNAAVDLPQTTFPDTTNYDVPGPGASISLKSGTNMGTAICTANPGDPEVSDNWSVQSGTVSLRLDKAAMDPITETLAELSFSGVVFKRVGGEEEVHIPDVTLPVQTVGWNP